MFDADVLMPRDETVPSSLTERHINTTLLENRLRYAAKQKLRVRSSRGFFITRPIH